MQNFKMSLTDPNELITIHKFNVLMRGKNQIRLCKIHKKSVALSFNNYGDNSFGAVPFEALLNGCCEQAVNSEWEFINETVRNSNQGI